MANRTLMRCATGAALAAALSLVAVTTSSADPRWDTAAAVGAGLAVGAAAATAAAPYANSDGSGYSGYGAGYYDYDPDAVVVTPGPGYYDAAPSYVRRGECHFSIRGC